MELLSYAELFVVLTIAYVGYSLWARLDPRYPIFGALGLLLAGAVVHELGATDAAEVLGLFAFLLLAGGVTGLVLSVPRAVLPGPDGTQPPQPVDQG